MALPQSSLGALGSLQISCLPIDLDETPDLEAVLRSLGERKDIIRTMQRAFGSESGPAALKQLVQLAKVHGAAVINGSGALDVNADIAAVAGIQPRDHLESMIATQMVALHNFGMYAFAQAMRQGQTVDGQALCLSQATRLLRSFREHVEALQRYRGKGQQRVTVEHVHVHQGGQAIVGVGAVQVPARSTASPAVGGGDATEK